MSPQIERALRAALMTAWYPAWNPAIARPLSPVALACSSVLLQLIEALWAACEAEASKVYQEQTIFRARADKSRRGFLEFMSTAATRAEYAWSQNEGIQGCGESAFDLADVEPEVKAIRITLVWGPDRDWTRFYVSQAEASKYFPGIKEAVRVVDPDTEYSEIWSQVCGESAPDSSAFNAF